MIYQTNSKLDNNLEHIGCAFDCVAYAREKFKGIPWTAEELQAAWIGAISAKIISGDSNGDGDLFDSGEGLIQDWGALARFLGAPIHFVKRVDGPYDPGVNEFVISAWYNPRTKFTHFVVGMEKPVEWDPIEGGSVTVRGGSPVSHRVFTVLTS